MTYYITEQQIEALLDYVWGARFTSAKELEEFYTLIERVRQQHYPTLPSQRLNK
jgi:hypothetical protein